LYSVEREPRPIVQAVISNLNLTPLAKHLPLLKAGIENAQGLIDQELKRLRRGVVRTPEDQVIIEAFKEATK
jgi:hypothetical protein